MLWRLLVMGLGVTLAGACLDSDDATPAPVGVATDCPTADAAGGDLASAEITPGDAPAAWELPACERACDRVVSCAVDGCAGWTWATSGALMPACVAACDGTWEGAVLAAPQCEVATAAVAAPLPELAASCDSTPCGSACERLGGCVAEQCPGIDAAAGAQLAADCVPGCDPDDAAWVMANGCEAIVDAISGGDPGFAAWCSGAEPECPGPELCEPYGEKVAGCIVAQCDGNADPYQLGLAAALRDWCAGGDDCPQAAGVEAVLDDALTCDMPPLAGIGMQPPFAKLCVAGPPSAAELESGCAALKACPGTEWLESVDVCMVLLGLRPDAAARAACLNSASGVCQDVYACLEGL